MIVNPITLAPHCSVYQALALMKKYRISGVPITEDGRNEGRLVGILTNRGSALPRRRATPDLGGDDERAADHRPGRHDPGPGPRDPAPPPRREAAGRRPGLQPARPDHGEGHPEGDQVPERLQGLAGPPARRRGGGRRGGHHRARRGAGRRPCRPARARQRARALRERDRDGAPAAPRVSVRRPDGRQRGHRGRHAGPDRPRRRRRQGGHRFGLDLHHAHRRRHRRADGDRGRRVQPRRGAGTGSLS